VKTVKNENIIWKSFAERHNAKYSKVRFGNSDFIEFIGDPHGICIDNFTRYRTVSMSTVSEKFTRSKAEFKKKIEFDFKIRPIKTFERITRLFNQSRFKNVINNYVYSSTNFISADIFFSNRMIHDTLDKYQNLQIELYSNIDCFDEEIKEGYLQLSLTKDGISESETELSDLFELTKEIISVLTKQGMIEGK